jgi:hypothetical protein
MATVTKIRTMARHTTAAIQTRHQPMPAQPVELIMIARHFM